MTKQTDTIALTGRILVGVLFLLSGIGKVGRAGGDSGLHYGRGLARTGRRLLWLDERGLSQVGAA
jgi:uncharacterized membrane protein YphA (DoxX/SURF4 family)